MNTKTKRQTEYKQSETATNIINTKQKAQIKLVKYSPTCHMQTNG